jgi:phospholipid/cholesterol/gamma-HCH transport system substrate-binding protein
MSRVSSRELLVGLVILAGVAGLGALAVLAGGGPGFLEPHRTIEVDFRDAQGLRPGCAVRVAGLDTGRVSAVSLVEEDGALLARARVSLPRQLADRLKQDARISVESSLTGQTMLNILSTGRSDVPLVEGQVVRGVESSLFDPILEQVGLGPEERSQLSQTIHEVSRTVEAAGPRLRQILSSLERTAEGARETAEAIRPVIESTAQRIDAAGPKVEATLERIESLSRAADLLVTENRPVLTSTLRHVDSLSATAVEIVERDRVKVETLIDGLNQTRQRLDRVLYNSDLITTQGAQMIAQRRADLDRTLTNVRDATGWADKLVQKLYSNPFYLSPLYKPNHEEVRAQAAFDAAQNFTMGARELNDALKTIQAMQSRPLTAADRQRVDQLFQQAMVLSQQLGQTQAQIAEGLRPSPTRPLLERR